MFTRSKNYVESFDEYIAESEKIHHILGGNESLDALGEDLAEFIRWQMTHSTKKKLTYNKKKFINCYTWTFNEITEWFEKNNKVFRYPVFLVERKETISVRISVSRVVKSRRKQHDSKNLLSTYGNERASHSKSKNEDESGNHIIYINTYYLSNKKGVSVIDFIKSDDFVTELKGTTGHELMHAFDSGVLSKETRSGIKTMKNTYKKYRSDFNIGKEYVTFDIYGKWNGKKFTMDKEVFDDPKNIRTFYYMLLYYITNTEMNAYLQTFVNQMLACGSKNGYDSDIYRRYRFIKMTLETEIDESTVEAVIDNRFRKDFANAVPKLAGVMKSNDISLIYQKTNKYFSVLINKYIQKMNKILYDIIAMQEE